MSSGFSPSRRKLALGIGAAIVGLSVCACIGVFVLFRCATSDPRYQATMTARAIARPTQTILAAARATDRTQPTHTSRPPDTLVATNPPKPTDTAVSTKTAALSNTPTPKPSSTARPTDLPQRTATFKPTSTPRPTELTETIVDVPAILGKPVADVEKSVGKSIEILPLKVGDSLELPDGGEARLYRRGEYAFYMYYDRNGIAKGFQLTEGLGGNYALDRWGVLLMRFGFSISRLPDVEAPATRRWNNFNGYKIEIVASRIDGPVWTVKISKVN